MTRLDFNLPPKQATDQPQADRLAALGKAQSSTGMALLLNSGKTGALAIAGTVKLVKESRLQQADPQAYDNRQDARRALRDLASGLVDEKGKVHSGYMSLSDDGQTLSNTSRWTSGDRSGAVEQVRGLIEQGYGDRMAELGMKDSLDRAIYKYLQTSGRKLGTRSLVALVRELEHKLGDDPQFLAQAQVGKARLQAGSVQAGRLPTERDEALKKLLELYNSQDEAVLQVELALVRNAYPWAEGTLVGEYPISHDHHDYTITGFADLKVMERLAGERGMPPNVFMRLLKTQGPDLLIDPAGANHPHPLGRQLYQDMQRAFGQASTLDQFHAKVANAALATFEETKDTARAATMAPLPAFAAGSLQHRAAQALQALGEGSQPLALPALAEQPAGPNAWPSFAMPRWTQDQADTAGEPLYRWGISLLFTALHESGRRDDLGPLNDLLAHVAGQPFEGDQAVTFSEELDTLLGQVPPESALAFGRDCLREALGWLPNHGLPYLPAMAPTDHPLSVLRRHPFLRSPGT
ncbi:MAG: hypothetical protein WCK08_03590 [Betaproteobacteria bacterium]